ncbi:MAG: response regulator [Elusimicrobiales bacterium]|nr:response regulator [Elusimicrobiales bacterium]
MAKILIIDDDDTVHLVYRSYLSKAGHSVESAYDGDEGLSMAALDRPDLVLVDINMPRLSGFEVLKKLKELPVSHGIPVLVITSLKQEHHAKRAASLGAAGFITKPTKMPELNAIVEKALEARKDPPRQA